MLFFGQSDSVIEIIVFIDVYHNQLETIKSNLDLDTYKLIQLSYKNVAFLDNMLTLNRRPIYMRLCV